MPGPTSSRLARFCSPCWAAAIDTIRSRPVASIWAKALAAEPADRYPSADALAADITRFLDGEPVLAHRESLGERAGRIFRKYQTAIILVLTYLLIRFLFLAARGL